MEYEFNKKSEYETCKEVFETYVALLEESVIRDERIRENGEKLLHNIKAELKEREEKKLDDNLRNKVFLKGRLERNEIKNYLNKSDVFVMISKHETFGLVYLEAMAAGCITIASKNEGFDGIIKDGVNGFLCEAGNTDELTSIINRINSMSKEDLEIISNNAQTTAKQMTDSQVAAAYINSVLNLI